MSKDSFCAGNHSIDRGYVHVYTGNAKGKTTAAFGLAFRAMGHGLKTYIGQFIKKHPYGELQAAIMVPDYITIEQYGRGQFLHVKKRSEIEDIEAAMRGLSRITEVMLSGDYNIVVADEILMAQHYKLVSQCDILALIARRPDGVEMILTGRYATKEIIASADLVTEMKEVKHYYKNGVPVRMGIEY